MSDMTDKRPLDPDDEPAVARKAPRSRRKHHEDDGEDYDASDFGSVDVDRVQALALEAAARSLAEAAGFA